MNQEDKIYVSGHTGMVGSALVKKLKELGYRNLILKTRSELNLLDQGATRAFFEKERPDYVFHLAAKVGGIHGNRTYPADFLYENVQINTNVIHYAHVYGVKKLLNLGSVCIYPVAAEVPIKESYLLTGPLEKTNEAYAIAKIASLMYCRKLKEQYGSNFISVMPANLYGINDNFHPSNAHVIPMLMKRFHDAKLANADTVVVWGTGNPTRDFLFADDLADGLIFLMREYSEAEHINIGPGVETSIKDLVKMIVEITGYKGKIEFDHTKPDGTPRRYLDTSKINNLGWKPKYTLYEGLTIMYQWMVQNYNNLRQC
ncbi:GDP-L-fucose synthase [Candidatus Dojkabacteria bacterium]|uniref:GDP-L-fucose synthase n=1 Tax=Candidatus Dojkabacteria bacterium TaxID=2099670 RepID=A0A3M0YZ13_9BACT|nr:MAG: GDP-L-fucose synthase [Candidatus Dojkabacteria bacterium]